DRSLNWLIGRAEQSVREFGGGADPVAFPKLARLLRYLDGEYSDPKTFDALRRELGDAPCPVHYLAIPQSMFEAVVGQLERTACGDGTRLILEKPFGTHLGSARHLNAVLHQCLHGSAIFRIDPLLS